MKLTIYVNFAGMCAEAFRYYEQHLGGKVVFMMKHGESPEPGRLGPDWQDAVLHARIDIGATELMGADIPKAEPMRSAYLSLGVDSDGEAERVFKALAEGGRVLMPLEETFFASRFGQVQDRFGMNWMVLHERPAPAS
jgi:PhnB protein